VCSIKQVSASLLLLLLLLLQARTCLTKASQGNCEAAPHFAWVADLLL
jgi:hypothetical protein